MSSSAPVISLPTQSSTRPSSTATPTDTSTAPTTSSAGSATSAAASSSSASSSSSSSSSATSSQSSSTAPSSSASVTTQLITSGGSVETVTSTAFVVTSTGSASSPQNTPSSSHSFFSNQGAVAGVFTVVGLIALGIVITLIINAVRRRRAQKFDRDVAVAAAEAAAMSRSPFDDYSYGNSGGNNGGGGGGGGYGYSDGSHGTYQLPPLAPQNEVYGMTEMSQYDPYAAGAASLAASAVGRSRSRKDSEPGAPGIAGVGAGTLVREPSKRAPYHAFAGPGPQPHELQGSNGTFRSRRSNQDVLEAVGLAPTNAAFINRQPSDGAQTMLSGRSKYGSMSSGSHHPAPLQPGYPVESYYPHRNDTLSPDPFAGYPPVTPAPPPSLPNPYGSGPSPSPPAHEDDGDAGSPTALHSADESRTSYQDDADYSQGHRVLRVANE